MNKKRFLLFLFSISTIILLGYKVYATVKCYPEEGCTGTTEIPLVGQLLTGSSTSAGNVYRPLYLSAGSNITISTSSDGTVTLTVSGLTSFTTTTINGLSATAYTLATSSDTNIHLRITTSSPGTITFTPAWNGTTSVARGGTGSGKEATSDGQVLTSNVAGGTFAPESLLAVANETSVTYNGFGGGISIGIVDPLTGIKGGTGLSTFNQGDMLYAPALNSWTNLAKDTNTTRYLANTGTSNNPKWDFVNLSNGVTSTLPYARGGTATSTTWTAGSIPFIGTNSFNQNNSKLYWDNTNQALLVGTSTFYGGQVVSTPRLEIAGAVNIRNNGATNLGNYDVEIMSNDSAGTWLSILNNCSRNYFGTLLGKITNATSTFQLYNETAGPIQMFTDNAERLRISETGKILILGNGVTYVGGMPYSALDVNLGSNVTGVRLRGGITAGARQSEIWDAFINTTGGINFTGASSTDTNAYFGIDPKSSLEEGLKLWDGGSGNYTGSVYSNFYVKDAATDYLNISVNATSTQFVIDSNGNIGIATSTPKSKLTVSDGDIYIASSTTVGGLILTSPNGSCYRVQITNG